MRRCRFPLPVLESEPLSIDERCVRCPLSDTEASIDEVETLIARFVAPGVSRARVEGLARLAIAEGEGRDLCVPLSLIAALERLREISPSDLPPMSEWGSAALAGLPVPAWPDGSIHAGAARLR